jgi:cysteine-rich repeat protein/predicted outer membrane repeat protein
VYSSAWGTLFVELNTSLWQSNGGFTAVWGQHDASDGKCGNGVKGSLLEECDDGNVANGDGCSSACTVETSYSCVHTSGHPASTCSHMCYLNSTDREGNFTVGQELVGYINNASCVYIFGPGEMTNVYMTFYQGFSTEPERDYVLVYTCPDHTCDTKQLLVNVSGVNPPEANTVVTSPTGVLMVKFFSDACVNDAGFTVRWTTEESSCGDAVQTFLEACDNSMLGCDGATCTVEIGYTCDSSMCTTVCGDGVKAFTEQCDDGNSLDGDGCTSNCTCEQNPCTYQITPGVTNLGSVVGSAQSGTMLRLSAAYSLGPLGAHLELGGAVKILGNCRNTSLILSSPGASITLRSGASLLLECVNISGGLGIHLDMNSSLEIRSMNADHLYVSSKHGSTVWLQDVKIKPATFAPDAALLIQTSGGKVSINNLTVSSAFNLDKVSVHATDGAEVSISDSAIGGDWQTGRCLSLYAHDARLDIRNSTLHMGWAPLWDSGGDGAGILLKGSRNSLVLHKCNLMMHDADGSGGCLAVRGEANVVTLTACSLGKCHALGEAGGGAISFTSQNTGTLVVENSLLQRNQAFGEFSKGGAVSLIAPAGTLALRNVSIMLSTAHHGAGVHTRALDVLVTSSVFEHNSAVGRGGAICMEGQDDAVSYLKVDQCMFHDNHASTGGAIYVSPGENTRMTVNIGLNVTVTDTKFESNSAQEGGAAAFFNTLVRLSSVLLSNNVAHRGKGGAMLVSEGCVQMTAGSVTSNTAQTNGGGIALSGSVCAHVPTYIKASNFTDNSASSGGALSLDDVTSESTKEFVGIGMPVGIDKQEDRAFVNRKEGDAWILEQLSNVSSSTEAPARLALWSPRHDSVWRKSVPVAAVGNVVIVLDNDRDVLGALDMNSSSIYDTVQVTIVKESTQIIGVAEQDVTTGMAHGFGLSFAEAAGTLYVSTFYSTVLLDIASMKFRVVPCASHVTAMTKTALDDGSIYIAVHDIAKATSSLRLVRGCTGATVVMGPCEAVQLWEHDMQLPIVRAMDATADGMFLAVAVKVAQVAAMQDVMRILLIQLVSGTTTTLTPLLFKNMVGVRFFTDSNKLLVLHSEGSLHAHSTRSYYLTAIEAARVEIQECAFQHNEAAVSGGAVIISRTMLAHVSLHLVTALHNGASRQGAFLALDSCAGRIHVSHSKVAHNSKAHEGGAIVMLFSSHLLLSDTVLFANSAYAGAALYMYADPGHKIDTCTVLGNGMLANSAVGTVSTLEMIRCTVSGHTSQTHGSIHLIGNVSAHVTDCNITQNSAGVGGALVLQGHVQARVERVNMEDNTASECGGAIAINNSLPVYLVGPVSFTRNFGMRGGAVCVLLVSAQDCTARLAQHPFMLHVMQETVGSPDKAKAMTVAQVNFKYNNARGGGAVFFTTCAEIAGETLAYAIAAAPKWGSFEQNGPAAYGERAATAPIALRFQRPGPAQYMPGEVWHML